VYKPTDDELIIGVSSGHWSTPPAALPVTTSP
jgi:hypothetical protein